MRSSRIAWLGWLLVLGGVTAACFTAARAGATAWDGETAHAAPRIVPENEPPQAAAPILRRDAPGQYSLSRAAFERALADPTALADAVRFAPVVKRKNVVGYRAVQVAATSPLADALKRGDIIERINGVSLADGKASLALLSTLQEQTLFSIEGRRASRPLSLVVRIVH